mgnify:FL=1
MKNISYETFIFRMSEKTKERNDLLGVHWALTYKCNLRCRHCYLPVGSKADAMPELSLAQVKNIIDQLYRCGCFDITFTGGEVFTRKDTLEVLAYLKSRGFHVSLVTNATLITEKIAGFLKEFKPLLDVSVSLYGLSEKVNSRVVGVKKALEPVLNAVRFLKENNVSCSIETLLTRGNLREFEAIREFARRQNIYFSYDYVIQPRLDGKKDVLKCQVPISEIRRQRYKDRDFTTSFEDCRYLKRLKFSKDRLFYCGAAKNYMAINPYGKANICLDLPLPEFDILEDGVKRVWNKIVEFAKNIKPSGEYHCYKCELGNFCVWCPAMGWRHKGNMNACVPFYKKLALMEKRAFDE